jgi:hypothetical protein
MDTHETIEVLLETVFSARSMQRGYKEDNWANRVNYGWEAVRKRGRRKEAVGRKPLFREDFSPEVIVRSRYQATTSEHTAGWKRLSVILKSVKIAIVL